MVVGVVIDPGDQHQPLIGGHRGFDLVAVLGVIEKRADEAAAVGAELERLGDAGVIHAVGDENQLAGPGVGLHLPVDGHRIFLFNECRSLGVGIEDEVPVHFMDRRGSVRLETEQGAVRLGEAADPAFGQFDSPRRVFLPMA
jgi:hypothetical protein